MRAKFLGHCAPGFGAAVGGAAELDTSVGHHQQLGDEDVDADLGHDVMRSLSTIDPT
jgi:hypothetical protein